MAEVAQIFFFLREMMGGGRNRGKKCLHQLYKDSKINVYLDFVRVSRTVKKSNFLPPSKGIKKRRKFTSNPFCLRKVQKGGTGRTRLTKANPS